MAMGDTLPSGNCVESPWCMDQRGGRIDPNSCLGSCDADGLWASEREHAVQGTDSDGDLGHLTAVRGRTQRVADHPFVSRDRRLGR